MTMLATLEIVLTANGTIVAESGDIELFMNTLKVIIDEQVWKEQPDDDNDKTTGIKE